MELSENILIHIPVGCYREVSVIWGLVQLGVLGHLFMYMWPFHGTVRWYRPTWQLQGSWHTYISSYDP